MAVEALDITVRGIVQGVGFRPFVYRLAREFHVMGWVRNSLEGAFIHAEGEGDDIDRMVIQISEHAPAAAQVKEIEMKQVALEGYDDFTIVQSDATEAGRSTLVSPDLATCDDCIAELFDPANRRYRYPFINCTNCGPRFTIIRDLPYDRCSTSMSTFKMCPDCAAEYADPADRRFHAQPDACFECGPRLSWHLADQPLEEALWATDRAQSDGLIGRAVTMLHEGGIVAVKGLGGFHLACDAGNAQAIARLRQRKHRDGKALAVMVANLKAAQDLCNIDEEEAALLQSPARPIVLLRKRTDVALTPGLADGLPELGIMLPYTPLQHLLLHDFGGALVMTSGNLHDEPIQTDDARAAKALANIADAFLGNDRPILNRFDDSVLRVLNAGEAGEMVQVVRRARGYAPAPITPKKQFGPDEPVIFAAGPEQKVTFAYSRPDAVFVSQHIGDIEDESGADAWYEAKASYEHLFDVKPQAIACDMHPEYLTGKWARRAAEEAGVPLIEVQHHHAHIAAVLAENGIEDAAIGIAFDGTGFGPDRAIWGGEVLIANTADYERFGNLAYMPMPGGAAAVREPLRMAYGALWIFDLLDHPAAQAALAPLGAEAQQLLDQMIEQGINTPMTSSAGRLFDAASALAGVCTKPTYQGEAAILFEAAIDPNDETPLGSPAPDAYPIVLTKNTATPDSTAHDTSVVLMDAADAFRALLDDLAAQVPVCTIARRFHDGIVNAIAQMCQVAYATYGITTVALAGGVFMNRYVTQHAIALLAAMGLNVALNWDLPANDGGVSFGQAVVARRRLMAADAESDAAAEPDSATDTHETPDADAGTDGTSE